MVMFSMGEVPLARLWQLSDGTFCLLLKDPRAENWQLRVMRNDAMLRSEHFSSPIVAMAEAKRWRAAFESSVEASR
jgi:hypothetical protein